MQEAIKHFAAIEIPDQGTASLAVKVAVAAGPARRFLIGDHNLHLMDALVGETLFHMAAAEQLAGKGEIVAHPSAIAQLGGAVQVSEWRAQEGGERFGVIGGLSATVEPTPWPPLAPDALTEAQMRPWLLPAVYERLREGLGEFLTELRPAVAVFVRFGGIDYENDESARARLDAYIRCIQGVLACYEGALVQVTIGEKGSYLYAVFGAPVAHEDDARRAVSAALELSTLSLEMGYINSVQIGVSQGTMRAGAYGGTTRRTYGVLGDEVNLAARLMQHASPDGGILVSRRIQKAAGDGFAWQTLTPIRVKGRSEPVPVAKLLGRQTQPARTEGAAGPSPYIGELVGRETELARLEQFIQPILEGCFAGLVYIYGEAGVGKSRLVYELGRRLAQPGLQQVQPRWLICPAEAILRQSLYPFKHLLREYFDQRADRPVAVNKMRFEETLAALVADLQAREKRSSSTAATLASELERTRSVLGALVDLRWDGSLYERLEPKLRFENTLTAFKTLIKAESLRQPVILHVEDAHWLDADSHQLLKTLTQDVAEYPFVVILAGRYRDDGSRFTVEVDASAPQHTIDLNELSPAAIRKVAEQILGGAVADDLADLLAEKTSGNPLFVEQVALDLRERKAVHLECGVWTAARKELAEVPASINAVLVARLDRLAARVKAVVQTAAVLGREFQVQVLSQMLRDDAELPSKIKQAEDELIWSALAEMRYIFRHALLRDAAYDMQLQARLRELHALAGEAFEQVYAMDLTPHLADLAYHYGKAQDVERERRYATLAGEQAAARFANAEAVRYLSRALELTPASDLLERYALLLAREKVYALQGNREAQAQDVAELGLLAEALDDDRRRAEVARRHAVYFEVISNYQAALTAAQDAVHWAERAADLRQKTEGLIEWSIALAQQGMFAEARQRLEEALCMARQHGYKSSEATCLLQLGNVWYFQGDNHAARTCWEQSLAIRRALGDKQGEANCLSNLVAVYDGLGDLGQAKNYGQEALALYQTIGDRRGEARALSNVAGPLHALGDLVAARQHYERALALWQAIDDRWGQALVANNLGLVLCDWGDYMAARRYCQQALTISRMIGDRPGEGYSLTSLALALEGLGEWEQAAAAYQEAAALRRELGQPALAIDDIAGLARVALRRGQIEQALGYVEESLAWISANGIEGIEYPLRVYLTAADVLTAAGQSARAAGALASAQALLQERAARISDETTRRAFLQDVPLHRLLRERCLPESS